MSAPLSGHPGGSRPSRTLGHLGTHTRLGNPLYPPTGSAHPGIFTVFPLLWQKMATNFVASKDTNVSRHSSGGGKSKTGLNGLKSRCRQGRVPRIPRPPTPAAGGCPAPRQGSRNMASPGRSPRFCSIPSSCSAENPVQTPGRPTQSGTIPHLKVHGCTTSPDNLAQSGLPGIRTPRL